MTERQGIAASSKNSLEIQVYWYMLGFLSNQNDESEAERRAEQKGREEMTREQQKAENTWEDTARMTEKRRKRLETEGKDKQKKPVKNGEREKRNKAVIEGIGRKKHC